MVSFLFFGYLVDFGVYRKAMLMITSIGGSISVISFFFLVPGPNYWIGGIFLISSNLFYGSSLVFYNSFLPQLGNTGDKKERKEISISNISCCGIILGFSVSIVLLVVNIILFFIFPESCRSSCNSCPTQCYDYCPRNWNPNNCDPNHLAYRINISSSGIWWLIFSFFTFLWLNSSGESRLPEGSNILRLGFVNFVKNFKQIRKYPETFRFIVAFWIYGDGMSTLAYGAFFLANQSLGMSGFLLGIAVLIVSILSAVGTYFWWYLNQNFPDFWKPKIIMITNISVCCLVPLWGYLMHSQYEFFIIVCIFGFNYASLKSFSRSALNSLIPSGKEAQIYSIYGFTERGSSWLGPLIVGLLIDFTEDVRIAIGAVIVLLAVGLAVLITVDIDKGKKDIFSVKS